MTKRPTTQETLLFALELLRRIPRNRKISASELHQQLKDAGLERELRTIQRQLEVLTEHFDIERDDRNKPYGYRWKERAKGMSLPMLSQQESLLLNLAEEYLRNLLPANLMKSMDGFFHQAKYNLNSNGNKQLEKDWLSKVRIVSETQPLLPPKVSSHVFEEVSNALYANKWLEIEYRNATGNQSMVNVMPLGLAQQGPRLYLVCRYKGFDNERSLALHRIISAKASSLGFERPKDFDLKKYDNDGRFGFGEGQRIKLNFRISKETGAHLLETPLSTDQLVKELKDDYEITATVVDSAQLEWWLRGFGKEISHISKISSEYPA
ncbi:MAG: WYL domain-containing protein [Bacteroidetes bacterium]|nr:WYL domain-containing protein [Bacteroidota bacterium]